MKTIRLFLRLDNCATRIINHRMLMYMTFEYCWKDLQNKLVILHKAKLFTEEIC